MEKNENRSARRAETVRWLLSVTRPVLKPLYFSVFMRATEQIAAAALFAFAGAAVVQTVRGRWSLVYALAVLTVLAAVKAAAAYLEQFSGHYVAFKSLELLRTTAFAALWPKAPYVTGKMRTGVMLTALTRDIDRIEVFYAHTIAPVITGVAVTGVLAAAGICLAGIEITAIPVLLLFFAVFILPPAGFGRALRATGRSLQARRELAQWLTDSVFGAEEVVGYGREKVRFAGLRKLDLRVKDTACAAVAVRAARRGIGGVLPPAAMTAVIAVGVGGHRDPALIAALAAVCMRIFEGPRGIEDALGGVDSAFAAARRLYLICHEPQVIRDGPQTFLPAGAAAVQWRDVSYAYPGAPDRPVLDRVNIQIEPGENALFVGHSGSGKSTLMQLLLRYDDPRAGEVLLAGRPVGEYELDTLRRAVAFVPQRPELLNSTIAGNMRLGAPGAGEEEMWEALEVAQLAGEIREMPLGLNTPTGVEGSALSGGQVQRLCLARALLTKPRVIVLDEFSANLNVELERKIRENLRHWSRGVTLLEITHRVENPAHYDRVFRIEGGRCARIGNGMPDIGEAGIR